VGQVARGEAKESRGEGIGWGTMRRLMGRETQAEGNIQLALGQEKVRGFIRDRVARGGN
jgi:uncharacterized protein YjbJ (UPF0337 family)